MHALLIKTVLTISLFAWNIILQLPLSVMRNMTTQEPIILIHDAKIINIKQHFHFILQMTKCL